MRRNPMMPTWATIKNSAVIPLLGASAGFVAVRAAGNALADRDMGTTNPKTAKLIAAAVSVPVIYALAAKKPSGMVGRHYGALLLGVGMASAEAYLRDTKLLGGSPAAAALTADDAATATTEDGGGTAGLASYYDYQTNREGQAAMFGLGSSHGMEAVSTVIPTDTALIASSMPQWAPVTEKFVSHGDKGYAGGVFARQLFSGMVFG
ncbi:MAG: hypothetical protein DRJ42_29160 [Deltaproteobacteria bacterium]|nr:MAG: hypothetical protein DRJ42_29160 [Deltaproteobacteria bacterium]